MSTKMKVNHINTNLKSIVIHQAIKTAGDRKTDIKFASGPLAIGEKEKAFIDKINKVYFKKSGPTFGIFANQNTIFKDSLNTYIKGDDFYSFTKKSLEHYKEILIDTPAASGGFLIFAHYSNKISGDEYVLVLSINNKDGYVVEDSDLTLLDIKNLDLNKVDIACIINLTKWKNHEVGINDGCKTYLSFIKGNKDISYYFMSFIDCDNKTTSAESTIRLIKAIDDFCDEACYDREERIRKREEIFIYCEGCIKDRKEIQLSAVSALLEPEYPQRFMEFASDEKYSVSPIISGDRAKLKTIRFISFKSSKMSVEFDSNLLGRDIVYNPTKKELTFKKIPQALIDQIPL